MATIEVKFGLEDTVWYWDETRRAAFSSGIHEIEHTRWGNRYQLTSEYKILDEKELYDSERECLAAHADILPSLVEEQLHLKAIIDRTQLELAELNKRIKHVKEAQP